MKKYLIFMVILSMLTVFVSCTPSNTIEDPNSFESNGDDQKTVYTLSFGTYNPENSADGIAAERFKEYAEETSGGRLEVNVYHNSTLGDSTTQIEGITMGTQDFFLVSPELLTSWEPKFSIVGLYFLYDNTEHLRAFYKSELFSDAINNLENQNILLMDKEWKGELGPYRVLVSSNKIDSYDDIKGKRVRIYENPVQQAIWNAFETSAFVVSYSEIYLALQQGMVSVVEVPMNVVRANSYCDIAKYVIKFPSYIQLYNIIGNKSKVDSLPEDLQEILYDAATEAGIAYTKEVNRQLDEDLVFLKEKGINFKDDLDLEPFRKKMEPVYESLVKDGTIPDSIVEKVRELEY